MNSAGSSVGLFSVPNHALERLVKNDVDSIINIIIEFSKIVYIVNFYANKF